MRENFFFSGRKKYAILALRLIGYVEVMAMKKAARCAVCALLALAVMYVCAYSARQLQKSAPAFAQSRRAIVVIDAGHGGEDGGAASRSGIQESEVNLQIAQITNDLLHFAGIDTRMIRTQDVSVYTQGGSIQQKKISDLKNRVFITQNTPNALLVSIHQNFFPEAKYRGAQVFYAKTPGSETLAERMQQALRQCADPDNHRRCKPAESVYLMEKVTCTAVLVECGFLSNEAEAETLTTQPYQQKLAGAICGALCGFLETEGESGQ